MDEEINNDPDFEQNSVDPFDSGESEIDDSGPEDDPPVQRIVDISSSKLLPFSKIQNTSLLSLLDSIQNISNASLDSVSFVISPINPFLYL